MKLVDNELLLPEDIPAGERILWRGKPEWKSLARRAFRADLVAGYFALMTVWNIASTGTDAGIADAALAGGKTIVAGMLAVGLLFGLAWLSSRTALYVITSRRVIMKVGIALPIFYNLPFTSIVSASVRVWADGAGDIPLALGPKDRIAYLHLWPHARPFRFSRPEPTLRSVADAAAVSEILGRALIAAANEGLSITGSPARNIDVRPAAGARQHPGGAIAAM